jgi:chemotaxis protein CheZ
MPVRRRVFRIEEMQGPGKHAAAAERAPHSQQDSILAELAALRQLIEARPHDLPISTGGAGGKTRDVEGDGLRLLREELDMIQITITRTKQEIAALHVNGFNVPESSRATRELNAVVGGSEQAIQKILAAGEEIDDAANTLSAVLKLDRDRGLAQDIRDHVVRIFEACNFHDLAGQRITKVMAMLKFIEDRVARMVEIWGGIEAFKEFTAAALAERQPVPPLLHGPRLDEDAGHASQDQIDALFRN